MIIRKTYLGLPVSTVCFAVAGSSWITLAVTAPGWVKLPFVLAAVVVLLWAVADVVSVQLEAAESLRRLERHLADQGEDAQFYYDRRAAQWKPGPY